MSDVNAVFTVQRLRVLACICLCLALLSLCTRWLWIGNLLNHLSAHVVLVILILMPLYARQRLGAALMLCSLLLFALPWIYQAYEQRAAHVEHDADRGATFLVANMAWWNEVDPALACQAIIDADADFCALIEVRPAQLRYLRQSGQWPFVRGTPRIGPYSMVIMTRMEIINDRVQVISGARRDLEGELTAEADVPLADKDMKIFNVEVLLDGRPVEVVVTHPPPPVLPRLLNDRSAAFSASAHMIRDAGKPCVLLGDLNTVPASYEWRTLHQLGLRRPHGQQQRTWMLPHMRYLRQFCGLAIDYIAASPELQMSPLQYAVISGSDHLALHSRISFPAETDVEQSTVAPAPLH